MSLRVAVLMPVRDAAATVEQAVRSLAQQTLPEFELVVVDDGSTDASVRLIHETWQRAGRAAAHLRLLTPGRVGLVAALATGLAACNALWVARMDADDEAHPMRLVRQAGYLEAHPHVGVVAAQVESFGAKLGLGLVAYTAWQNALLSHAAMMRERFVEAPLTHPSVMFRRDCVRAVGGYRDAPWAEDYDLWLRLAAHGVGFAKLPEVLLRWRDHAARATRRDGRYGREAFLRCKAHHLARGPLWHGQVVIWGAGVVGRHLSRYLAAEGCETLAFVDVDLRKIGGVRRGHVPVLGPDDLPFLPRVPLLAAVGSRGARDAIRSKVLSVGYVEGENFWCVA